jgi:hypothetical protein
MHTRRRARTSLRDFTLRGPDERRAWAKLTAAPARPPPLQARAGGSKWLLASLLVAAGAMPFGRCGRGAFAASPPRAQRSTRKWPRE